MKGLKFIYKIDKLWSLLFLFAHEVKIILDVFVQTFTRLEKSVKYLKAIDITQGILFKVIRTSSVVKLPL